MTIILTRVPTLCYYRINLNSVVRVKPMSQVSVKPTDRAIAEYYNLLHAAESQDALHESNVRQAFQALLGETARVKNWTLVAEPASVSASGACATTACCATNTDCRTAIGRPKIRPTT